MFDWRKTTKKMFQCQTTFKTKHQIKYHDWNTQTASRRFDTVQYTVKSSKPQ